MESSKYFENIVPVLKLEKNAMLKVAKDPSATTWGIVILFGPPVINLILASFTFPSGFGVMLSRFMLWPMLIPAISIFGIIFTMSILAIKSFGGVGKAIEFFRTVSVAAVILWISVIPYILSIFGILDPVGLYNLIWLVGLIWIVVVAYHMLMEYHKLTSKDAGTVVALGILGYFILRFLLGKILVGGSYRLWY